MKRMYIAITLVVISVCIGILQWVTIDYSSNKCINQIELVETELGKNDYQKAHQLCEKAIEEYEFFTENILYCYYQHSSLEEISQNLTVMSESIKIKDINRFKTLSVKTKEQLQALKDEELLTIQNIL